MDAAGLRFHVALRCCVSCGGVPERLRPFAHVWRVDAWRVGAKAPDCPHCGEDRAITVVRRGRR